METLQGLLAAYEASALGLAARGTVWLYPAANLLHVFGAALLLGAIAVFDVAVLRASRFVGAIGRAAWPIAAVGLALQLATGLVLFAAEATTMAWNLAFLGKLAAIAIGIANLALFHWRFSGSIAEGLVMPGAKALAGVSLVAWTVTVLAGRGIAYL